jgi:predicted Zn-dependent protease
MIKIIQNQLNKAEISEWTILEKKSRSKELFFIRKDLDMNRSKDVCSYRVTVFKDYMLDSKDYRGSATVLLADNMNEEEINEKLKTASYAASFVKNPYYPIPSYVKPQIKEISGKLSNTDLMPVLSEITESLYKNDNHKDGGVNSSEIFINQFKYHFISSKGSDVSYKQNQGEIELICDWNKDNESVELYNMFSFADYSPSLIEEECKTQIEQCRLRAEASKSAGIESVNVILRDFAVREMMDFYKNHSNVKGIFEGTARGEKGKIFQGENVKGDLLDISLDPALPHSPYSAPIDKDGVELKRIKLYEKGKLLRYQGSQQFSHYLEEEVSGLIPNIEVGSGSQSIEEWKKEPYVEIMTFSDFQMDPMTGDFGGEIRLALYFDGDKLTPISGASISACLFDVQKEMYLSNERLDIENYSGPKFLMFPGGTISGE